MVFFFGIIIVLYVITIFSPQYFLEYFLGLLALVAILLSINGTQKLFRNTGLAFLAAGFFILPFTEIDWKQIPLHMFLTLDLLTLLFVLPLIHSIIKTGKYDRSVSELLKIKMKHFGQLYSRSSLATYLLSSFLHISTIPLIYSVTSRNFNSMNLVHFKNFKDRFISTFMLRSYALCILWSPFEIIIAITVDTTGIAYFVYLPLLLAISVLLLILDWLLGSKYKKYKYGENYSTSLSKKSTYLKIVSLFLYLSCFITLVHFFSSYFYVNFIISVALVIIPFSFLWAISICKLKKFSFYGWRTLNNRTASFRNYLILFLPAGFFISIFRESPYIDFIQQPLIELASQPLLLFFVIQMYFLILALVGFNPLVSISILSGIIAPVFEYINPLSVGLVLITSSLSTLMIGPFNLGVSIISMLIKRNPYQISYWNLNFSLLLGVVGMGVAYLLL